MPHKNRVDPFGKIHAVPQRGTLMGNRGNLHDADRTLVRPFKHKQWVSCVLQYHGRQREIMAPGRYTELFFMDEATALAAGHRPCGTCRKAALRHFKECWKAAMGMRTGEALSLKDVDQRLHEERTVTELWSADIDILTDGVMVLLEPDGSPHLLWQGRLLEWSFDGYRTSKPIMLSSIASVLTPKTLVQVLKAGYPLTVHPSATT
jgi:hypothetical protein